jgi:two-component system response regulator DesR
VRSFVNLDVRGAERAVCPTQEAGTAIRVLLVVQMSLLRGALDAVLSAEDDLEVAAGLGRVDELTPIARAVRPDVIVIDLDLLVDGALSTLYQLGELLPDCALLVLGDTDNPGPMRAALDMHVRGFVGKDTAPGRFVEYVRKMAHGERVIDPTLAVAALRVPRNPLTARELEVLQVAASGVPSAEVASQLHLSVGTVRNYMSAIMRKTRARNRLEAVRIAVDSGWL